jgi:hypothetical protein
VFIVVLVPEPMMLFGGGGQRLPRNRDSSSANPRHR